MSARAVLDAMGKENSVALAGNRTPIPRASSPLPSHYNDWDIPARARIIILTNVLATIPNILRVRSRRLVRICIVVSSCYAAVFMQPVMQRNSREQRWRGHGLFYLSILLSPYPRTRLEFETWQRLSDGLLRCAGRAMLHPCDLVTYYNADDPTVSGHFRHNHAAHLLSSFVRTHETSRDKLDWFS